MKRKSVAACMMLILVHFSMADAETKGGTAMKIKVLSTAFGDGSFGTATRRNQGEVAEGYGRAHPGRRGTGR